MANPTFNNRSLQDDNYITENVNFRTRAKRKLSSGSIARRMGKKLTEAHIQEKTITITGIILADTAIELQTAVDNLLKDTSKVEGSLVIEDGRTYTATVESVNIPDRTYSQTMVEFNMKFVCSTPYSKGAIQTAGFVVASGIQSLTLPLTISGTVQNRPLISMVLPSGTGISPIGNIQIQNVETANTVTISGSFNAETTVNVDYDNFNVTVGGTSHDYSGQFDALEPGSNSLILTFSGMNDGVRSSISYNPRYW